MNQTINEVTLVGNMVMDARWTAATETSQSRAFFKFAISPDRPGGSTTFINVIAWDTLADELALNGEKGRQLYLHGKLDTWNNTIQLVVDKVQFWAKSTKQQVQPRQPLSPSERPKTTTPTSATTIAEALDDNSYFEVPDSDLPEPAPVEEPQVKNEPEKMTTDDKEQLARELIATEIGAEGLKEMLMTLTREKMKADSKNSF